MATETTLAEALTKAPVPVPPVTFKKLVKVYPVPEDVKFKEVIPPVPLTPVTTAAALELLPVKSVRLTASLRTYPVPAKLILVIAETPSKAEAEAPDPPPPVIETVGGVL